MPRYNTDTLFESAEPAQPCSHTIRVAFESGVDNEFDYLVPDSLWPIVAGQRVEVPFGRANKIETAFCVQADPPGITPREPKRKTFKLKKVSQVIDKEPLLDSSLMALAKWISDYYVCPLGQVFAAMVPAAVKKGAGTVTERYVYLGADYQAVQFRSKKQKRIVEYLLNARALDQATAVELRTLLAEIDCTDVPLKHLADRQIIRIAQKTTLKSLPVIPDSMAMETASVVLNEDQKNALAHVRSQIDSGAFGVTCLFGVTDSGKTEIYIRAIEHVLQKGKGAIVLLPEIALTAQTVQRFASRFEKIAVMHSGLTAAQRNVYWQKIKSGDASVVIGARSAVFAPLPNLGLVVVDEEHEPSYKQDTAPRYHGRDAAIKRAQIANALCILGSATPSLETLQNCKTKKHFTLVHLPKRVLNVPFPQMHLVDMRQHLVPHDGVTLISNPLAEQIRNILEKKEQAILLLNRRGYSNFVFCPSCKHILHCRNCDVTLTFHKRRASRTAQIKTITGRHIDYGYALCHYCGSQTLVPEKCPLCGKGMAMIGMGSQRLEEELARRFPQARVSRVDSDSMQHADYYRVLRDFSEGKIDILAGTQMLAKGLHFPNVTLVGVISADTCLYLPDFRANERTFQLISQVAGRAGRSQKKGDVFVQTFLPDQPAIQFALKTDFDGFVAEELKHRKACNLPPYWRLAAIVLRDEKFDKLEAAAKAMRQRIDGLVEFDNLQLKVRGPMPCAISRIQRFHRLQIILQAPDAAIIQQLFSTFRRQPPIRPTVTIAIDVDPVDLL